MASRAMREMTGKRFEANAWVEYSIVDRDQQLTTSKGIAWPLGHGNTSLPVLCFSGSKHPRSTTTTMLACSYANTNE